MQVSSVSLLASYPAFGYLRSRFSALAPFAMWNVLQSTTCASMLIGVAAIERTLTMAGPATGFFEHPGIIIFLIAQAYVPVSAMRCVGSLMALEGSREGVLRAKRRTVTRTYLTWFQQSIERKNPIGRRIYGIFVLIGIGAYAWNCYQNQFPYRYLGFDFWDSAGHPLGYAATRLYKLYLWVFLIPAVAHSLLFSVWTGRKIMNAVARREFTLNPYDEDGCGGVRILIDTVIDPIVPIVLVCSSLPVAAFIVHNKLDVTTVGGFALGTTFVALLYLIPAISLRRAIRQDKSRQAAELRRRQSELYSELNSGMVSKDKVRDTSQVIMNLSEVVKQVNSLPEWPQFGRIARVFSLLAGSPLVALMWKHGSKFVLEILR